MPFIQIPKLNIHYEAVGTGSKVLVMVHGNFASWQWWRPVMDRLPPGYRAYTPDLRGCGETDQPADGYSVEQLAADLYHFVTQLGLSRFHLVGHSLGGAVSLQFALDHSPMVQSLLLVAPAPAEGMSFLRVGQSRGALMSHLVDPQRETSLDWIESNYRLLRTLGANRPWLRRALRRVAPTLNGTAPFKVLVDDAARMAPEALVGYFQSLDTWNVQARLHRLKVPVLILAGEQDVLVPLAALERTAAEINQAQLVVWADVGHSPQLEQPDRFAQLLIEFVDQNSASSLIKTGRRLVHRLWNKVNRIVARLKDD
jgi:3-oxoadipate enol-lactonase